MERFETKFDLLNKAYKDSRINKGTLELFQYLVYKSDDNGCFPAVNTIAESLSCCRRTVQNNMRKLEHFGYIIRKERWYNHQQLSNKYIFNLDISEDKKTEWIQDSLSDKPSDMIDPDPLYKNGFYKVNEIGKIFDQKLTGREKLLMIYCYHKANQTGIMYGTVSDFCNDLGISGRTLYFLLVRLRKMGLLRIKTYNFNGHKGYVVQLTGRGVAVNTVQSMNYNSCHRIRSYIAQNISTDQREGIIKNDQCNYSILKKTKYQENISKHILVFSFINWVKLRINNLHKYTGALFRHLIEKEDMHNTHISWLDKIRKILRI